MQAKKGQTDDGKNFYDWKKNNPNYISNKKIDESQIYPSSLNNFNIFEREYILESKKKIELIYQ